MHNVKIQVFTKFTWVEMLKISPAKFSNYKNEGLPSQQCNPLAWEKYVNDLEGKSESSGSMQYAEAIEVAVCSVDGSIVERKLLNAENFKLLEFPAQVGYDEGKNYLIRVQSTPGVGYSKNIPSSYESDKLTFDLKPEYLPGGQIIRTLIGYYDGQMFDYPRDCYQYTESEVYLVDGKGNKHYPQVMTDDLSVTSSNQPLFADENLTDWYVANINPIRIGLYEIEPAEKAIWPSPAVKYANWNGTGWFNDFGTPIIISKWRGLKMPT